MKIIDLNKNQTLPYKSAVALGNFDGIHIGHEHLIRDNILKSKEKNLKSSVLLFKNHTKKILTKNEGANIKVITSYKQKLNILNSLGLDIVYVVDFNKDLRKLTPEEFIDDIIINKVRAKIVTVGFDYRFGFKALGDSKYLKEIGHIKGFDVNIIEPVYFQNQIVSSTIIRNLIENGNISKANKLIGRNYAITGTVIKGSGRGRNLGFPTANIELDDNYVIPKIGVYRTSTIVDGTEYLSLTNIGYNPTFNGKELKIENYILNFKENIYNQNIEVNFSEFIRDDIKFNNIEDLIAQIKEDVNILKKHL